MYKGLLILSLASCVFFSGLFAQPVKPETAREAYQLIDNAIRNSREMAAYTTTETREHGRGTETIRRFVRNSGKAVQSVREERSIDLPRVAKKTTVFIQNNDGFWQIRDDLALRLMFSRQTDRPIPRRMPVAQNLCFTNQIPYDEEKYLSCTIDRDSGFFGTACTKITIKLSPEMLKLLDAQSQSTAPQKTSKLAPGDAPARIVSASNTPAAFVYYISNAQPFIMSWQSYATSGAKIGEVSFQKFNLEEKFPDSLFAIPPSSRIITVADNQAYGELMSKLSLSTPLKK